MERRRNRRPRIVDRTISRRQLLEWLGAGATLSLSGLTLAACAGRTRPSPHELDSSSGLDSGFLDAGQPGADGHRSDTGQDAAHSEDASDLDGAHGSDASPEDIYRGDGSADDFPFAPGELDLEIFSGWGERTVDSQDLSQILSAWQLQIDGLVQTPTILSFADLLNLSRQDMLVDFHCVEGWSIYNVPWHGLHLSQLFDLVGVQPTATHATFHTIGGTYNESLPLDVALEPRTQLSYGIGGQTLPLKHGFPLRIVIPRLWAYKSAKYVHRIELTDHEVEGFWVQRGYPYAGDVPASRLREGKY